MPRVNCRFALSCRAAVVTSLPMGHTRYSDLQDLQNELDRIRSLEGVKERSPGVFYLRSQPFLHFHDKDGLRWADLKVKGEWSRVDVPFQAKSRERGSLLRAVTEAHRRIVKE